MRLLDRYILGDLVRVVLLTTAVLVTVIAFGATIKPLAQDNLLSAGQTAKYILLAIVPMLQFALPFSAGFASTISLHRMATDNEILAAAVGGISYRRLLAPIVLLGVVLTVIMIVLTQWVIPRFWSLLEQAVAQDVTRVFQAAIQRGEPFRLGDREIYADRVIVQTRPDGTEVDTRLVLIGVAATDMDPDGRVDKDVTANKAVLDIYRRPGVTYLKLDMFDTVAYNPDGRLLVQSEHLDFDTIVISGVLAEHGRHMTRGELLAVRRNPDGYGDVLATRLMLADALRNREIWADLDGRQRAGKDVLLTGTGPDPTSFAVRAAGIADGRFVGLDEGPVEIVQREGTGVGRRFRAAGALLRRHDSGPAPGLTFDLELDDCEVVSPDLPGISNRRDRVVLESLAIEGIEEGALDQLSSTELIERCAAPMHAGDEGLAHLAEFLTGKIDGTQRQISSRLLKRYALSTTALLLLVLGATLGMWLRGSLPLSVYLWAFVPSILDLLLITSGGHMIRAGSTVEGFAVMWGGNAVLALMLLFAYVRLARH